MKKNLLWSTMLLAGAFLILGSLGFAIFAEISRVRSEQFSESLTDDDRLAEWIAPGSDVSAIASPQADEPCIARYASLYPGSMINPKYWDDPEWAGPEPFGGPALPDGYEITVRPGQGLPLGSSSQATRIRMPSIKLDEVVEELDLIVNEGDSDDRYEQPVRVVGHIRETANPGENGNGWYFGHQSSLGSSEGAVFRRIPEIFDQFRKDPVFIYFDTASGSFAYRVFGTDVVDRENLRLASTNDSTITLVTSWPPLVFDQRFLVFAELVGIKRVQ